MPASLWPTQTELLWCTAPPLSALGAVGVYAANFTHLPERSELRGGAALEDGARAPKRSPQLSIFLSAIGWAYQYSTNNNYVNTFVYPNTDNPNLPHTKDLFTKDYSLWNVQDKGTDKEYSTIAVDIGAYSKAPEPSWKKWE